MEFEAATNSNGTVSPIRGILSLASDDAAAAEEAFPELAEEATVKEEEEEGGSLPGKCSDSREGEEAGNSNVASEVKDEKEEGVRNSSSSDEVAGTTTTVTVTVATSNLN